MYLKKTEKLDIDKVLKNLPTSSGVYFFKNVKNTIIYVGKAKNLKKKNHKLF